METKNKMVYSDGTHLIADTLDELHEFAKRLSLHREWYQGKKSYHPHYDLFGRRKRKALKLGAKLITEREAVKICQEKYSREPYIYKSRLIPQ